MPARLRVVTQAIFLLACSGIWPAMAADTFAVVGETKISYDEFERAVAAEARQRFYHSKPLDEEAFLRFRAQVAQDLVDRELKLQEARRLGVGPDSGYVESRLASYEARYGDTERWESEGETMLSRLRAHYEDESRLELIEKVLSAVDAPSEPKLRAYYESNKDKFTEPERVRMSVILLGVPPTSSQSEWDAAVERAKEIGDQLQTIEQFTEAARRYSDDPSAEAGGDTGFMHAGVLSPQVQNAVDRLKPGEMLPEPIIVLEGVVLLRLEDRLPQMLHEFEDVRERAEGLWRREAEQAELARRMADLRAYGSIEVDEEYLKKLPN